ncbi:MAG: hypothetical protein CL471_08015, partial [Acidobacteria bacterium]|nr:hypothetical protein [Acidobacteriota bacterium]
MAGVASAESSDDGHRRVVERPGDGIVHAAQVNAKAQAGDIAGAEESARKAKMWSLWGLGLGLVVFGGYVL